jgi:hypothetical protein
VIVALRKREITIRTGEMRLLDRIVVDHERIMSVVTTTRMRMWVAIEDHRGVVRERATVAVGNLTLA